MGQANRSRVIILFVVAGLFASAMLLTWKDFFPFSAIPGLSFAAVVTGAALLSSSLGILPKSFTGSPWRLCAGGATLFLTYPVALFLILGTLLTISTDKPGDSDRPDVAPLTETQIMRNRASLPAGLFTGGLAIVYLAAGAVRQITKRWPRRIWAWALIVSLGVPCLSAGMALVDFTLHTGFRASGLPTPDALLFAAVAPGLPLLLLVGEPVLAGLIGYWLSCGAEPTESPLTP